MMPPSARFTSRSSKRADDRSRAISAGGRDSAGRPVRGVGVAVGGGSGVRSGRTHATPSVAAPMAVNQPRDGRVMVGMRPERRAFE
jgi:hypothetical protein